MYDDYGDDDGRYGYSNDYAYDMPRDHGYSETVDSYSSMPDLVKKFLPYFRSVINKGHIFEIQNMYENSFPKLSEEYFDKTTWPDESEVAPLVDNDTTFLILYKELYYRHIYARIPSGPSLQQRIDSFYNYCHLFNYILGNGAQGPISLELPDQWLWEIVDEFIYQFQTFSQYRAKLSNKTPDELDTIHKNNIWSVYHVLNALHHLIEKSNIKRQLEVYASGGDPDSVAGEFGKHSLYKMLGYFSLVGLLRLHSLLGDYYQAIKVLENIELHNKKSQYSHVPACQISTCYYVGFAYMMMRRYSDAIRTFSSILLYIQRTQQLFQTRSYQNDQINKQTDQMYHLLAICLVLHPQCVDESIQQVLRDKSYNEKMFKMQWGDESEFEACFLMACPKFLSPSPPPAGAPLEDYTKDPTKHQTKVFMDEVRQQKMLPTIRSYMKLYTTLPITKLVNFMSSARQTEEVDLDRETHNLIIHLLSFKHKMKNVVWTRGTSGLDGKFASGSELDFYIDGDMIHIADTKVAHRYGDFFIRKILKFEELNRKLHMVKI